MKELEAKVITIVADILVKEPADIKPESHLRNDLEADSLDTFEIVMAVEKEFSIAISDPESERIETVKDIIDLAIDKAK